jgi:hypothetical protein
VGRGAGPALYGAQSCNLLAYAPQRLHEDVTGDYHDMIYGERGEIEARRTAGQINMSKADGWQASPRQPSPSQLTSPPETIPSCARRPRQNSNHIPDGTYGVAGAH